MNDKSDLREKMILLITEHLLKAGIKQSKTSVVIPPTIYLHMKSCNPVKIVDDLLKGTDMNDKSNSTCNDKVICTIEYHGELPKVVSEILDHLHSVLEYEEITKSFPNGSYVKCNFKTL